MDNKKIFLPFTINNLKGGGKKKSFKILNENEITKKSKKTTAGMFNFLKKIIKNNKNNKNNNNSKINFVKASETENYYKTLKTSNKKK
jgi:hypothetical protein